MLCGFYCEEATGKKTFVTVRPTVPSFITCTCIGCVCDWLVYQVLFQKQCYCTKEIKSY